MNNIAACMLHYVSCWLSVSIVWLQPQTLRLLVPGLQVLTYPKRNPLPCMHSYSKKLDLEKLDSIFVLVGQLFFEQGFQNTHTWSQDFFVSGKLLRKNPEGPGICWEGLAAGMHTGARDSFGMNQ